MGIIWMYILLCLLEQLEGISLLPLFHAFHTICIRTTISSSEQLFHQTLCLFSAGKKKSCQTMPPITNGEVVHINHDVRKVICVKGFKLAVKSSRFMRCNYSTGSWSYNGNPECIGM